MGVFIQPCEEVAVAITVDNILETEVETFRVSLADTNFYTRLRVVSDVFSTVYIGDNDGQLSLYCVFDMVAAYLQRSLLACYGSRTQWQRVANKVYVLP